MKYFRGEIDGQANLECGDLLPLFLGMERLFFGMGNYCHFLHDRDHPRKTAGRCDITGRKAAPRQKKNGDDHEYTGPAPRSKIYPHNKKPTRKTWQHA